MTALVPNRHTLLQKFPFSLSDVPLVTFRALFCSTSNTHSLHKRINACIGNGERPWKNSDARLVLEDGSIWKAKSFGASGTQVGEVVFNTSLTG